MILKALYGRVLKLLGVILIAVTTIFGLIHYGRQTERKDYRIKELEAVTKTNERINSVEVSPDRSSAIGRLRSNGIIRKDDL